MFHMFHSSLTKFRWEKTGDGEGEKKRGRRGARITSLNESFLRSSFVKKLDVTLVWEGRRGEKRGEKRRPDSRVL